MAKNKKNILTQSITEDQKVKPHFFLTETWKYIKGIIDEIKYLLCNKFFKYEEVKTIEDFIEIYLNDIASTAEDVYQLYESHRYVEELIEYYIEMGLNYEEFESVANLKILQEILNSRFHII